jgi:hypothetical protein
MINRGYVDSDYADSLPIKETLDFLRAMVQTRGISFGGCPAHVAKQRKALYDDVINGYIGLSKGF